MAINVDGLKEYISQMPLLSDEEREYLLRAINRSIAIDKMRTDLHALESPGDHAMRSCLDSIDVNAETKR
jgi:hypothetical protein